MITSAEVSAAMLTLGVTAASVALNAGPGLALGWLLARRSFPGRTVLETAVMLPLVLPPVVTGWVLLVALGRDGAGPWLARHGIGILFTWKAMAVAAAITGLPLLVRSVRAAIEAVDPRLEEAARTLGHPPWRVALRVTLPLSWPGIAAGFALSAARAMGEFGATRLVSLNTDGQRTLPLEICRLIETPGAEPGALLRLVLVSVTLSALALALCDRLGRRGTRRAAA